MYVGECWWGLLLNSANRTGVSWWTDFIHKQTLFLSILMPFRMPCVAADLLSQPLLEPYLGIL